MKLAFGIALTIVTLFATCSLALAQEQVVVCSWGGTFQEAERKAIFTPFAEATGIKVVEDSGPERTKLQAMVESGNVQWDVAEVHAEDYALLVKAGQLEKIDYSYFDPETKSALTPGTPVEFGVGGVV